MEEQLIYTSGTREKDITAVLISENRIWTAKVERRILVDDPGRLKRRGYGKLFY